MGSEGAFWRVERVQVGGEKEEGRIYDWWRMTSCVGERLGKGRWVAMCCGREDRGVFRGRERLSDLLRGAMGLRMTLTAVSIVKEASCVVKIFRILKKSGGLKAPAVIRQSTIPSR